MVPILGVQLQCRLQAEVACDTHDSHRSSGEKVRKIPFFLHLQSEEGQATVGGDKLSSTAPARPEQTLPASFLLRHWLVQKAGCPTW